MTQAATIAKPKKQLLEPICTRCIYDSSVSGISFDDEGVCNYCRHIESLLASYQTGKPQGEEALNKIIEEMKREGRRKKYDCVIGVSGGTDSSFLLLKAKEWGLRALAVHYDNTWNSAIATENIRKVTSRTKTDLFTYVINNEEADDIFKAFFLAGVPEFDASTDMAFAQVLRMAAAKHGVRYILEGHSFQAEGVSPIGKNYFDGKYIESVCKQFGSRKLKTYPLMSFAQFMKWTLIYRQKFIRPLWYLNYSKEEARKRLTSETGWQYYGGHHLENLSASFLHSIYNPRKFNIDNRNWALAAEVRAGVKSREDAISEYLHEGPVDPNLEGYVQKRLGLTREEFERIMTQKPRSFRDFKTYKRRFELLRPLFRKLADHNLVPKSFYAKYCFPISESK